MRIDEKGKQDRTLDGILFGSIKEMKFYADLKLMERAGEIKDLKLQPMFVLQEGFINGNGEKIRPIKYIADFMFWDNKHERIRIIDCKGKKTDVYKLKKKMFDFVHDNFYLEEEI